MEDDISITNSYNLPHKRWVYLLYIIYNINNCNNLRGESDFKL